MSVGSLDIITDGLVFYVDIINDKSYPGSGTNWYDLTSNGNNGSFSGSPTVNQRFIGFDGVVDYINFGSIGQLQFSNSDDYSISTWFRWTTNLNTIQTVFSYALSGGAGYYIVLNYPSSDVVLSDYYDGSNYRGLNTNSPIPKNEWCNIVVTSDTSNSSAGMNIYLNGEIMSCTSRGFGPPNSINYSGLDVNIATRMNSDWFEGDISSIMVYNRALTPQEILHNYNKLKWRFL